MANGTPMGRTVTASSDRRTGERTVPPSGWEHEVRDRVVAGDDTALREVYDQYSSFVYGLALRVIGDPRAAEDVSQDVFVAFWERPAAFDPDRGSLRTWLGTLTHRRAVDHVRREEARRRRAERDASRAVAAPDVEEMATALLTAERVRAALERAARPTSAGPSSSRTSAGRPTARSRRCSASPRAPRSRGCGWRCGGSPMRSKPKEMSGERTTRAHDAEVEELLGVYALDACEPDEAAAIEAVLARRPDLAHEADRLSQGGGVDRRHRGDAASAAHARRRARRRARRAVRALPIAVIDVYLSLSERFGRAVDDLPDAALDDVTPNGLTAHDLVVHVAAQESLLAQNLGVPTFDAVREEQIVARTDAFLPRFADRDLDRLPSRSGARRSRPTGPGRSPTPTAARSGAAWGSPATTPCSCGRSRPGSTPTTCGAAAGSRRRRRRPATCR